LDRDPTQALDALADEARAGKSDAWLAARADLSVRQVQAWRKDRGIKPVRGAVETQVNALQGLAKGYDPKHHRTAEHLDFASPAYVIRHPLDYTGYARGCFALLTVSSFSTREIASATGTRERDVELALSAWRRHLSRKGRRCLGCDVLLDPRFGEFCSRSCRDRAIR
jgi:hypothetical protein